MDKPFQYQFEWDPTKARQNSRPHRVTFERAATVFLDPNTLSVFDAEHSQDKGQMDHSRFRSDRQLLVVCHTFREETETRAMIRIITARKATKNEVKQYERK